MRPTKEEEQELIRYYEERKGRTEHWGKPIPVRPRRGNGPSTVFSLRLTGAELTLFSREANRRRISVSELVRQATLREIEATSGESDLKQTANALRRIADQLEREANGAETAYRPSQRQAVLAAGEEPAEYRADTEEASPPKRRGRPRKA
jgi:hypothetical protein